MPKKKSQRHFLRISSPFRKAVRLLLVPGTTIAIRKGCGVTFGWTPRRFPFFFVEKKTQVFFCWNPAKSNGRCSVFLVGEFFFGCLFLGSFCWVPGWCHVKFDFSRDSSPEKHPESAEKHWHGSLIVRIYYGSTEGN